MFRFLLIALAVSLGSGLSIDNCPFGLPRDQYLKTFGNSCFTFHLTKKLDYEHASAECKREKGTLVLANSDALNKFLVDQLVNTFKVEEVVWIGLNDMEEENTFVWDDGSLFNITGYWNFADKNGPRKSFIQGDWEDCVTLNPKDGKWHDYHCRPVPFLYNSSKYYICENQVN